MTQPVRSRLHWLLGDRPQAGSLDSVTDALVGPRWIARSVLILATLVYGLALAPIVFVVPLALLGINAPGPAGDAGVWPLALSLLLLPITLLLAIVLPWLCYRRRAYGRALALTTLPLAGIAGIMLAFGLVR